MTKLSASISVLIAGVAFASTALAQSGTANPALVANETETFTRPVSTYSIVARDAQTGEMGVAVQSHWFSVGSVVTWGRAGVGVVATQSLADVRYGPLALELLAAGKTPEQALRGLTASDPGAAVRQVAILDAQGLVATHTGERCIAEASHVSRTLSDGDTFSAQANLMARPGVPEAMAAVFERQPDRPLAERLVAALHAAEAAGGDIRGKQSAAILVVSGDPTLAPWQGRIVDLRVEDHPDPNAELSRLLTVHRAYEHMNAGDLALEHDDVEAAVREYGAAARLNPGNSEMLFWAGVAFAKAGRVDDAVALLAKAYDDPNADWRETLRRLPPAGLLPDDPALLERLLTARAQTSPAPSPSTKGPR
ncbi:MAG: DUF1028 domain-containing protein [Phycisphaerales bacterium]